MRLHLEVLEREVIERNAARGEASETGPGREPLGLLLGGTAVRGEENEQRRTVKGRKQLGVCVLGVVLAGRQNSLAQGLNEVSRKNRLGVGELRKVLLSVEELLKLGLDVLRVEGEGLAAGNLQRGVPPVKRPVAGVNTELSLLQNLKRGCVGLGIRQVGEYDRGALELVRLVEGLKDL